jgi:hypothetical protein
VRVRGLVVIIDVGGLVVPLVDVGGLVVPLGVVVIVRENGGVVVREEGEAVAGRGAPREGGLGFVTPREGGAFGFGCCLQRLRYRPS